MHPSINAPLDEWLGYIESIHPTEIELGLDRLKTVSARLLSHPIPAFVFTVAGTNGKGTTTAALSALTVATGKTVGWYCSPHLRHFNERIQINNIPVADELIVAGLYAIETAREQVSLSYFEYTTLAACWIFQQAQLDVWVLEVGLGGRLDAVNIIDADVAVITNIGLDHQGFLGDTLDQIGFEKAGIVRADKPVVLGSSEMPDSVFQHIDHVAAQAHRFGEAHGVTESGHLFWQQGEPVNAQFHVPLANASTALQAFSLSPFALTTEQAVTALASCRVPGRLESFHYQGREVIVDVGHNAHAAKYIAGQLSGRKYHLIIGMLADKDAESFLSALAPITASIHYVDLTVPRGLTATKLKQAAQQDGHCHTNLISALTAAMAQQGNDALFIGGSFYTVCAALDLLEK